MGIAGNSWRMEAEEPISGLDSVESQMLLAHAYARELGVIEAVRRAEKERARSAGLDQRRLRAAIRRIDEQAEEAMKLERAATCLYWGAYRAVENLVHRGVWPGPSEKWSGEGRLGVQFQRGARVADLFGRENRQMRIFRGGDERDEWAAVDFRVGTEGSRPVFARLPARIGLYPPMDRVAKWAYLQRRLEAGRWRWRLSVTLAAPSPRRSKRPVRHKGAENADR